MHFELSALGWCLAVVAAGLVGLSKAGFGLGAALVAVPLMFHVLGGAGGAAGGEGAALGVMLIVLIAGDVMSLPQYPRTAHGRSLKALLPGLVLGVGGGWLVLDWFRTIESGDVWLQRSVGALSVVFVGLQIVRGHVARRRTERKDPWKPSTFTGVALGACAGLTSTLAHAGGPVVALYLLPQELGRRTFVGTVLWCFFTVNMLKLIPYAREGYLAGGTILFALILLPAVAAGAFAGPRLNKRFSDRAFRWVIYGLAVSAGAMLLLKPHDKQEEGAGAGSVFERSAGAGAVLEADAHDGDDGENRQQHEGLVQQPGE